MDRQTVTLLHLFKLAGNAIMVKDVFVLAEELPCLFQDVQGITVRGPFNFKGCFQTLTIPTEDLAAVRVVDVSDFVDGICCRNSTGTGGADR